jgi:hypothetical protein
MRKLVSDLPQAQYAAIGKVACEWAHVERLLPLFVIQLAKVDDDTGRKIATDLGNVSLINLILALAHDQDKPSDRQPPIYQHLLAVSETIHKLRADRNIVVHGDWTRDRVRGRSVAIQTTAKGQLKSKAWLTSKANSEAIAVKIAHLHDKLLQIYLDHQMGLLAPLPPKSRKQPRAGRRKTPTSAGKTPPSQP